MARLDVYKLKNGDSLVVDLQTDGLDFLRTRVVIPLVPEGTPVLFEKRLTPLLEINGKSYNLLTPQIVSISVQQLGPVVDNLDKYHSEIVSATDFLFQGW